MEQTPDWSSFLRRDDLAVTEFLVCLATILGESKTISDKETLKLRNMVSAWTRQQDTRRQDSLAVRLSENDSDFFDAVLTLFGEKAFSLNLFRFCLKQHLDESNKILSQFGQTLLDKAKVFFNRTFFVYVDDECTHHTLFSTALIDWAERVRETQLQLEALQSQLSFLLVSAFCPEPDSLAIAMGFAASENENIGSSREASAKDLISLSLQQLSEQTLLILKQLQQNGLSDDTYQTHVLCDWLKAESQRLGSLSWPIKGDLAAWEARRLSLLASLSSINSSLGRLHELVAKLLIPGELPLTAPPAPFSTENTRRLAFCLYQNRVPPKRALEAAKALADYCDTKDISPSDLLEAELAKIHPHLKNEVMNILRDMTPAPLNSTGPLREKNLNLKRAARLQEGFARCLVSVLLMAMPLLGCGLKTPPRSDILDVRPEIPYRIPPAVETKEKEIDSSKPAN